jgi:dynactin complex subunit
MVVYYDSINIGAQVEFLKNDKIYNGIVRYKGGVINRDGDWIGVEAEEPGKLVKFNII